MSHLSEAEFSKLGTSLPDWRIRADGKALEITYKCANFPAAMGFILQVAFAAEMMNHHPEWSNVYNRVAFTLTTHDVGGLSKKDVELAEKIQAIAAQIGANIVL